jgi:hypothetical protein
MIKYFSGHKKYFESCRFSPAQHTLQQTELAKMTGQRQPADFTLNKSLTHIVAHVKRVREMRQVRPQLLATCGLTQGNEIAHDGGLVCRKHLLLPRRRYWEKSFLCLQQTLRYAYICCPNVDLPFSNLHRRWRVLVAQIVVGLPFFQR